MKCDDDCGAVTCVDVYVLETYRCIRTRTKKNLLYGEGQGDMMRIVLL